MRVLPSAGEGYQRKLGELLVQGGYRRVQVRKPSTEISAPRRKRKRSSSGCVQRGTVRPEKCARRSVEIAPDEGQSSARPSLVSSCKSRVRQRVVAVVAKMRTRLKKEVSQPSQNKVKKVTKDKAGKKRRDPSKQPTTHREDRGTNTKVTPTAIFVSPFSTSANTSSQEENLSDSGGNTYVDVLIDYDDPPHVLDKSKYIPPD